VSWPGPVRPAHRPPYPAPARQPVCGSLQFSCTRVVSAPTVARMAQRSLAHRTAKWRSVRAQAAALVEPAIRGDARLARGAGGPGPYPPVLLRRGLRGPGGAAMAAHIFVAGHRLLTGRTYAREAGVAYGSAPPRSDTMALRSQGASPGGGVYLVRISAVPAQRAAWRGLKNSRRRTCIPARGFVNNLTGPSSFPRRTRGDAARDDSDLRGHQPLVLASVDVHRPASALRVTCEEPAATSATRHSGRRTRENNWWR